MAAQKPVLVVFAENESLVDKEFFSALGFQAMFFSVPGELFKYLKTLRPHALCIVANPKTYFARPQWLKDIERRSTFEGLRVLAFVIVPRGGQSQISKLLTDQSEELLRIRLSATLALRDFIVAEQPPFSLAVRKIFFGRVSLALGSNHGYSGEEGLALLIRDIRKVKVGLPGRLSWMSADGLLSVECSVRVQPGTECVLRFGDGVGNVTAVQAIAISSSSNKLRFNFGSEVTLRLEPDQKARLGDFLLSEETRVKDDSRPVMRSMVILRKAEFRERISDILRSYHSEVRIPLLSKNVKNDIARMDPQIVVIEDAVVLAQSSGANYLAELRSAVSAESHIVVIGPQASELVGKLPNVHAFAFLDAEISLRHVLEKFQKQQNLSDVGRKWFAADSDYATCLLELEDRTVFVGNSGVVIEGPHVYRSLSNVYLSFRHDAACVLVKNAGSYVTADTWKNAPGSFANSRYYFSILIDTPAYGQDFQSVFHSIPAMRVGGVGVATSAKSFSSQSSALQEIGALDSASSGRLTPVSKSVDSDSEWKSSQEYTRTPRPKRKVPKRSFADSAKDWSTIFVVFLLIGVVIYLLIKIGQSQDDYLKGSFENLYELYGK